jgi:hypothetical protein
VEEIDQPDEANRPIILDCRRRLRRDRPRRRIGPISRDEQTAAVGEHHQQHSDAATAQGAHDRKNTALEGMPLADDFYRTWKVAEMGSVWWRSSTRSRRIAFSP